MERYYVYLNVESYLAEWFRNQCGDFSPVVIKRGSAESDILELFLARQPLDFVNESTSDANLIIELPFFKYKDVRYYNYLPPFAKKALVNTIYNKFRVALWNDLNSVENSGCKITDLIYAWMEANGISDDGKNWETIRQMYFRMRKKNFKKSLQPQ